MFRLFIIFMLIFAIGCGTSFAKDKKSAKSIYDIEVMDIDGRKVKMSAFRGKALLIVNVASRCGFTNQYKGLQALYKKYKKRGLLVLGFPSNDFGAQEPGTNKEIKSFCSANFSISFPMFAKITVKGKNKHQLYQFLTSKNTNPKFSGSIPWNFNKFLVNKSGKIVARFNHRTKPQNANVVKKVESTLK